MKPYHWHPIELPPAPEKLAVKELRAFTELWKTERDRLENKGSLAHFAERLARRWSIETGIVERVFDVNMGVTLLLVEQGFDASLIGHGDSDIDPELLVDILRDHRESLDLVMDVVGGSREFSVGWIKEIHALMTRHQKTSLVLTPQGYMHKQLAHGELKRLPNNPSRPDGSAFHEYCPPEQVASEMDRLVELYAQVPDEYPEVRAAWIHHAFTQIHPFEDGNGRVARALASVDFIRAGLFPLLVDRSDFQRRYLPALEQADSGDLGPLVRYFAECQQRMLMKAISEAEATIASFETIAAVLKAAKSKVGIRKEAASAARAAMAGRFEHLRQLAADALGAAADRVQAELPDVKTGVTISTPATDYYYRYQIAEFASRNEYWADLRERRAWARLQLRDGGVTDVLVSFHFIGNPSPGTAGAAMFLVHRDKKEADPEQEAPPSAILIGVEPLLLAPSENEAAQKSRVSSWLEAGLVQALAQWTRYL